MFPTEKYLTSKALKEKIFKIVCDKRCQPRGIQIFISLQLDNIANFVLPIRNIFSFEAFDFKYFSSESIKVM